MLIRHPIVHRLLQSVREESATAVRSPPQLRETSTVLWPRNPVRHSRHSRHNLRRYLDQIAALLTGSEGDALSLDWGALRFQYTAAIRARLLDSYAPATVNGMLAALRGVLKAAWQLGQMGTEDYRRPIPVKNVKGETLPGKKLPQR